MYPLQHDSGVPAVESPSPDVKDIAMSTYSSRRNSESDGRDEISGGVPLPSATFPLAGALSDGNAHLRNQTAPAAFAVQLQSPVFSARPQEHLSDLLRPGQRPANDSTSFDLLPEANYDIEMSGVEPAAVEDSDSFGVRSQEDRRGSFDDALDSLNANIQAGNELLARVDEGMSQFWDETYSIERNGAFLYGVKPRPLDRSVNAFLNKLPFAPRTEPRYRSQEFASNDIHHDREPQGIDWKRCHSSATDARRFRNHLLLSDPDNVRAPSLAGSLPRMADHLRFRHFNSTHRAWIAHWQLCNLVSATSARDIYYAGDGKVHRVNAVNQAVESWVRISCWI